MHAIALSPDVLAWAANEIGESLPSLARFVAKRERDRANIVEGRLTAPQAEKVSKLTGVPFGLLFLETPPTLSRIAIPDLRQTADAEPLSRDFSDVLADAVRKQEWFIDRIKDLGAQPLAFVGRYADRPRATSEEIAADLVAVCKIDSSIRAKAKSADEYFTLLAELAEAAGVLVMKSGIVRSNTKRVLSVKEFRGFAIVDTLAPLVFINGRDAEVASVFTLLHELAHIWLGRSGVSDLGTPNLSGIEKLCNRVAADVLVPKQTFLQLWERDPSIDRLARYFRVSRLVVARRALDLGKLDFDGYDTVARATKSARVRSGGGSAYVNIPIRNSKRLTASLVASATEGRTLLREAANLLAVRPETVMELGRRAAPRYG